MAPYGHAEPASGARPAAAPGPMALAATKVPAGTFASGTKIQVGSHRVVILKYLSEGGFAHVYLVKLPAPIEGTDQAVLKRVAVPDKEALRSMRTEVETMKRLKGHKPIVTYIDSHASELRGGGYEVFLLMEFCNGGGLIDYMNTRLQHRLTEPEIVTIFADVAEGVACMHYLRPPLLHRDLKVENVLITLKGTARRFKVCDFGSAAPPKPAPTSVVECQLMDEDVQKHTTMQYRSPEMIDVYRKLPIDEKSDIWALGVLLYKLCFYTTPFEEQGQLAILNATYRFPTYPVFSDRLKELIASMLREQLQQRPNIYQVLKEACAMSGRDLPIKDIYAARTQTEGRSRQQARPPDAKTASKPAMGAVFAPPSSQQKPAIPEVERMRRGRLPALTSSAPAKRSSPPRKLKDGDPFAALDKVNASPGDELSSRFPTLDEFSLLLDRATKFDFDRPSSATVQPQSKDLAPHFAKQSVEASSALGSGVVNRRQSAEMSVPPPKTAATLPPPVEASPAPSKPTEMSRASAIISNTPELQAISSHTSQTQTLHQPAPSRPAMVSVGTMTTTPSHERMTPSQYQRYRLPPADQWAPSASRKQDTISSCLPKASDGRTCTDMRDSAFQIPPRPVRHPSSSRPSLEGSRPSMEVLESLTKPRSQARPVSTYLESNMDYLREKESHSRYNQMSPLLSAQHGGGENELVPNAPDTQTGRDDTIDSNVEFLRQMEESDAKKNKHHGHGQRHHSGKRSSLSSLGAGTKSILAGKFGDAFKRFEGGKEGAHHRQAPLPRTPSPLKALERRDLTPIAGSEAATDGPTSDDGENEDDMDGDTPEMRRDREQRMLAEEEARVAAAQAEHKQRVARREGSGTAGQPSLPRSIGGVSRAVSIQNKVQSLLEESIRPSVTTMAEGYGHYSDMASRPSMGVDGRPLIPKKPLGKTSVASLDSRGPAKGTTESQTIPSPATGETGPMPPLRDSKPTAPPKPTRLNSLSTGSNTSLRPGSPPKPSPTVGVAKARPPVAPKQHQPIMVASKFGSGPGGQPVAVEMSLTERQDYLRDFQQRFPSLGAIEMVERDLAAETRGPG